MRVKFFFSHFCPSSHNQFLPSIPLSFQGISFIVQLNQVTEQSHCKEKDIPHNLFDQPSSSSQLPLNFAFFTFSDQQTNWTVCGIHMPLDWFLAVLFAKNQIQEQHQL